MDDENTRRALFSIASGISQLRSAVDNLSGLIDSLLKENAATRLIHQDLTKIMRDMSAFMSEVPNMLNALVKTTSEVRDVTNRMKYSLDDKDFTKINEEIAKINIKLDTILKYVEAKDINSST